MLFKSIAATLLFTSSLHATPLAFSARGAMPTDKFYLVTRLAENQTNADVQFQHLYLTPYHTGEKSLVIRETIFWYDTNRCWLERRRPIRQCRYLRLPERVSLVPWDSTLVDPNADTARTIVQFALPKQIHAYILFLAQVKGDGQLNTAFSGLEYLSQIDTIRW